MAGYLRRIRMRRLGAPRIAVTIPTGSSVP
jgi:hypothetical protein